MAVQSIVLMGDPRLLQRSEEVTEFNTPELQQIIDDLLDTLAAKNGTGLAAPQIGVLKRIVVFGLKKHPRFPEIEPIPLTILINPHIEILTEEMDEMWEGCISIPGLRGLVPRYTKLRYQGFDQFGKPIDRIAHGYHARAVQHECDHLDGILYPVRMTDMRMFGFEEIIFAETNQQKQTAEME